MKRLFISKSISKIDKIYGEPLMLANPVWPYIGSRVHVFGQDDVWQVAFEIVYIIDFCCNSILCIYSSDLSYSTDFSIGHSFKLDGHYFGDTDGDVIKVSGGGDMPCMVFEKEAIHKYFQELNYPYEIIDTEYFRYVFDHFPNYLLIPLKILRDRFDLPYLFTVTEWKYDDENYDIFHSCFPKDLNGKDLFDHIEFAILSGANKVEIDTPCSNWKDVPDR